MLIRSQIQPQGKNRADAGTVLGQALSGVYVPGLDVVGGAFLAGLFDRKGSTHLLEVGGGAQTKAYGPQGLFYADAGTGYVSGAMASISTFPIVIVAAAYFNSGANNWTPVCLNTSGGAGSSRADIRLASGTTVEYSLKNNFGTTAVVTATGLTGLTTATFFIYVAQSLSATDHRLYVGGNQFTSSTNMGGITNPYNAMIIGGTGAGGAASAKLSGGVLFAGYGNVAIPDSLALELSRSPRPFWNMFARQGRRYMQMAPVAAGGFFSRYYYDMGSVNSV